MNLEQVTETYEAYEQKIGDRKRVYETSGELCVSETIEKGVNSRRIHSFIRKSDHSHAQPSLSRSILG